MKIQFIYPFLEIDLDILEKWKTAENNDENERLDTKESDYIIRDYDPNIHKHPVKIKLPYTFEEGYWSLMNNARIMYPPASLETNGFTLVTYPLQT